MPNKTISDFTDLIAWQKAHELLLIVYRLSSSFPAAEQFGLTSQIRRSTVSITSNIAEGFNRPTTADKARFYYVALGSCSEVQSQLIASRDLGFLKPDKYEIAYSVSIEVHKIINGLIKSLRS